MLINLREADYRIKELSIPREVIMPTQRARKKLQKQNQSQAW